MPCLFLPCADELFFLPPFTGEVSSASETKGEVPPPTFGHLPRKRGRKITDRCHFLPPKPGGKPGGMPPPRPDIICGFMPPSAPIIPRPPLPIFFITSDIWRCILRILLTSETSTPAPAAIRLRREPLMTSGFTRSSLVIEEMIASCRFRIPSSS